jgi:hypothetical protein
MIDFRGEGAVGDATSASRDVAGDGGSGDGEDVELASVAEAGSAVVEGGVVGGGPEGDGSSDFLLGSNVPLRYWTSETKL